MCKCIDAHAHKLSAGKWIHRCRCILYFFLSISSLILLIIAVITEYCHTSCTKPVHFILKSKQKNSNNKQQQSSALNKLSGKFTDTADACGNSYAIRKSFNMTVSKEIPLGVTVIAGFQFHFCQQILTAPDALRIYYNESSQSMSNEIFLLAILICFDSKHSSIHPLFSSRRCLYKNA